MRGHVADIMIKFQKTLTGLIALLTLSGCDAIDVNDAEIDNFDSSFDRIPTHILTQMEARAEAQRLSFETSPKAAQGMNFIGHEELTWDRDVVTVAFEGGNPNIYKLIEQTAHQWTQNGGSLSLSFKDGTGRYNRWNKTDQTKSADIRISFRSDAYDGGYWSVIGKLADGVDADLPTMNYQGFDTVLQSYINSPEGWLESYERATILHEFGHALGLAHEHFHPDCQSDMKTNRLVRYFMSTGWTRHQSRFNIDADYYLKTMQDAGEVVSGPLESEKIDRDSVMLYRTYSPKLYKSGVQTPCKPRNALGYATFLSAGDRAYYNSQYGD